MNEVWAKLADEFITEKRYLSNLSRTTLKWYAEVFHTLDLAGLFSSLDGTINSSQVLSAIVLWRERGIKSNTVNTYLRGLRSLVNWLIAERGHPVVRIKSVQVEELSVRIFDDDQLRTIIQFKPTRYYDRRLHTVLLLLIDTGVRISEALTLRRDAVDLDSLLISVMGKGRKERRAPISVEMRKKLFLWFKFIPEDSEYVFPTRSASPILYDNIRRDFNNLMERLGMGHCADGAFHAFRRTFATNYIREGGREFTLQRLLGHTTLEMTNRYVKLSESDLGRESRRTSLLSKLRRG